jgi:hypothetical protein
MNDFHHDILPLWELSLQLGANHQPPATARGQWLRRARALARQIATHQGWVTVDCVRSHLSPPKDGDPRIMGAILHRSEFECVRYIQSTRSESHKRPIGVFVLKK